VLAPGLCLHLTFSCQDSSVLVGGNGPLGISLVREILHRPELHLKVVGFFLDERGENIGKSLVILCSIGAIGTYREYRREKTIASAFPQESAVNRPYENSCT